MVYILPTKKEILIWDKKDIISGKGVKVVSPPTYRVARPFSFWKYRNLKNRSLIIGFVGPRGSGKSVGAARTIILDYMLRGKTVWSNMEVGFNLISGGQVIMRKSEPLEKLSLVGLDQVYSNGIIYVDEVNLLAEARRAMSRENVAFSYILQQLRKRRLSIIWSAQSENHCDDRLRWQTDIFVLCEDVSINRPNCDIGAYSRWKAHDYSGVVKGRTFNDSNDNIFYRATMWNKPWWKTYSTWELQDVGVGESVKHSQETEEVERAANRIVDYIRDEDLGRINKRPTWKRLGITDETMMMRVSKILSSKHGIVGTRREFILEENWEAELQ